MARSLPVLTPTEHRLLQLLAAREGQWVPKAAIIRALWGAWYVRNGGEHTLRVNLARLRRKLALEPLLIENKPYHGLYRLVRDDHQKRGAA